MFEEAEASSHSGHRHLQKADHTTPNYGSSPQLLKLLQMLEPRAAFNPSLSGLRPDMANPSRAGSRPAVLDRSGRGRVAPRMSDEEEEEEEEEDVMDMEDVDMSEWEEVLKRAKARGHIVIDNTADVSSLEDNGHVPMDFSDEFVDDYDDREEYESEPARPVYSIEKPASTYDGPTGTLSTPAVAHVVRRPREAEEGPAVGYVVKSAFRKKLERRKEARDMPDPKDMIGHLNAQTLAYIGDVVYEQAVREHFIWPPKTVNAVTSMVHRTVCAEGQAQMLKLVEKQFGLTSAEEELLKKGGNSVKTKPANCDIRDYKAATGFEVLIGYLHYTNKKRLEMLLDFCMTKVDSIADQKAMRHVSKARDRKSVV